ncbi:MAG: polysaccharide biosynthesis protein [Phycisphaerales bacterium]|nr:polysaccharide biosynthesis protein [Phycisphaerales bacterium]
MSALRVPGENPSPALALKRPDVGPMGLPRTGLVLIGTTSTVRALAAQLAGWREPVIPVGCILINRFDACRSSGHNDDSMAGGILPPLLGFSDELIGLQAKYRFKAAIVSIPTSMQAQTRRIRALLQQLTIAERFVPTFEDLLAPIQTGPGAQGAAGLRPTIDVAALIGRTHWGVDKAAVGRIIKNKRVLITGAGGSIGGELARVVAGFAPSAVLLMERAENALFEIDQQLGRRFPGVQRQAVLHDVVDQPATHRALAQLKPDIVFHAAAHKHVPLMEDHPSHALTNNLFGTRSIADASLAAGVERFVMISSDKAVNPTSVMGATKRLAEMYISAIASSRGVTTRFSMVRFGNVLASACSVVPIWSQQLAEGHPVTVTDPRMTRYFMTIPEAATLVVQAAALDQPAAAAPVYVLDMGEPISILEMAVRFLRQHGYEAAIDSKSIPTAAKQDGYRLPQIEDLQDATSYPLMFTGARPGEKLHEELAYNAELLNPTAHPAISQWGRTTTTDAAAMLAELEPLRTNASQKQQVVAAIRKWVPEMKRAD